MTADPIKAALAEAERAFNVTNEITAASAAELAPAIAAFLRALHPWTVFQGHGDPPVPGRLGSGNLHDIATAVERAAREGGG
jgi:hypothetical protein